MAHNGPCMAWCFQVGTSLLRVFFWKCFCDDQRTVVQKTTPSGSLLQQWTSESPFEKDLPATIRSIDHSGEHIYIARMNNWLVEAFSGNSPSQVEIFKMDTALNVLGSFLLDGFEDNTYFYPSSLKAAQDGSVFITGSLRSLDVHGSEPQGWVAKIGADSFVSVMERPKPTVSLFPNPGTAGFQILLGEPINNGSLELHDVQGKLVHTEPFTGVNGQVMVPGLKPGVYCVSLRNTNGTSMLQQRWVKQ